MASRPKGINPRDSKLSHEIKASGQPVQDGAQTLKSHSIWKEATQIVCVLLMSNAIIICYYKYSTVTFSKNKAPKLKYKTSSRSNAVKKDALGCFSSLSCCFYSITNVAAAAVPSKLTRYSYKK